MRTMLATLTATLVVFFSGLGGPARADDTDLFIGPPAAVSTAKSNVLFIIDNSASGNGNLTNPCGGTNSKIESEKCIIADVLSNNADVPKLNIGLEVFNPSAGGVGKGGYIRYHVRDMDVAANRTSLISSVNTIPSGSGAYFAKGMHEAYLYYSGKKPYVGVQSSDYDSAAYNSGIDKYNSPAVDKCQRNYVIFIGNGGPDSGENNDAQTLLGGVGGSTATISLNPNNSQSCWADEYARFMYGTDIDGDDTNGKQNIITYSIAINTGTGPENTTPQKAGRKLIESMAIQGNGVYYEVANAAQLKLALAGILRKIQAVNSVFAAVTLPVSVNVRGTYLNQVYMGVFRPDADAFPRWVGNLKEYQLTLSGTGNLQLSDKNGALVTNSSTGFVNPDVQSYWTENSSYWSFSPKGDGGANDNPDGDLVEKGAAAQWLRTTFATSQAARKLYTCTGTCTAGSLLSGSTFTTLNGSITAANTGTADATEKDSLVNWVRGQDNKSDENTDTVFTDVRASIHGDVLHSRPAVVNYNRHSDNNDVFVFYGGNDGIFHAIQGGQLTSGTRKGGIEHWGFIPNEFFGRLKRLRDNNVDIMTTPKPYFVDGPIGVYQLDVNKDGILKAGDGDQVQLFLAMRRGGDLLYALDVSTPDAPTFMWKKNGSAAATASTGYGELAQTWSTPKPVKIRATSNPVLIMGAGYDAAKEDLMPQGTPTKGRGVMVIDATNGSVLWQAGPAPAGAATNKTVAGMTHSFAAETMVLNRDFDVDNYADRVYAADTGGNIWRLDIDDANPANWAVTKIAALGGSGANARKFLFAPDVIYGDSDTGSQPYDAILIGSGDREHPFDTTITNRFYMLKDTNMGLTVDPSWTAITETAIPPVLYDTTSNLIQEGTDAEKLAARNALNAARGWYITLATGEKVVGGAVTLNGTVFFGTNRPSSVTGGACNNLGEAKLYAMNFGDGSATLEQCTANGGDTLGICDRSQTIPGGGFPPSPTPVVTIIDGQPREGVVTGTHVQEPPGSELGLRRRIYWHQNIDK